MNLLPKKNKKTEFGKRKETRIEKQEAGIKSQDAVEAFIT